MTALDVFLLPFRTSSWWQAYEHGPRTVCGHCQFESTPVTRSHAPGCVLVDLGGAVRQVRAEAHTQQ